MYSKKVKFLYELFIFQKLIQCISLYTLKINKYFEDKNGMTLWMIALAFKTVALELKVCHMNLKSGCSGCR